MLDLLDGLTGIEFVSAGLAMVLVLVLSLSLHEFGHAFIAYKQGDYTPKEMGRVTLNPLAHMDPIGFVCCLLFRFGWAKPVEINPIKFRKYRQGMLLTSIAGVAVNLILAFIGCGIYYACIAFMPLLSLNGFQLFLLYFSQLLYSLNICLFVFNLLPIYPLDGFNCISALTKYDNKFVNFMRQYGSYILIVLVVLGGNLLGTLVSWVGMPLELFWRTILL
ncbi:MAG: site-2 protease family protein [Clostridia bacterium]|nr:site-2 protease family protein [Clostridia bacterium]